MITEFRKEEKEQEEHNGDQTWMMATAAISSEHEVAAEMNHKKMRWCAGKTQRDRVEREVGGGIGMGSTCISKADSCQCMTKTTIIL